jgi:acetyl esterase
VGLLLGRREMEWFRDHYLPNEADRRNPDSAPLLAADHSSLPPAYILVAEYDPLRDDGFAYADKLRAAGVPVTVKHYEDQLHVFFTMVNVFESADEAVADVGKAIRAAVEAG